METSIEIVESEIKGDLRDLANISKRIWEDCQ